jgi:pyrroloquinoline quinone biosynthesis protein B
VLQPKISENRELNPLGNSVKLIILGTAQDAGSPQITCEKDCCKKLFEDPDSSRKIVALGLADGQNKKSYLFEATPEISDQLHALNKWASLPLNKLPNGVFLTHAHIGHYTGLMFMGKESLNSNQLPVYAMPGMTSFLTNNGPWGQLVSNKNILLEALTADKKVLLSPLLTVTPFLVPHRDEYSETVGFLIKGPHKQALFIPDIDKWARWDTSIIKLLSEVDYAFVDATFYDGNELNTRDISEIPHPFVIESMALFKDLPAAEKNKIYFIHLNHTNPLLNPESREYGEVINRGFHVATFHQEFEL